MLGIYVKLEKDGTEWGEVFAELEGAERIKKRNYVRLASLRVLMAKNFKADASR